MVVGDGFGLGPSCVAGEARRPQSGVRDGQFRDLVGGIVGAAELGEGGGVDGSGLHESVISSVRSARQRRRRSVRLGSD